MNRRRARRGFSIVQTIGAIFVTGLLTMTGARVLQIAYRAQRSSLEQLRQIESLAQISDRMKADAAKAITCTADAELELQSDDQIVRYALDGDAIVRRWGPAENAPEGSPASDSLPGEQRWPVPTGTTISWQLDQSKQRPLLTCRLAFGDQRDDIHWAYLIKGASDDQ